MCHFLSENVYFLYAQHYYFKRNDLKKYLKYCLQEGIYVGATISDDATSIRGSQDQDMMLPYRLLQNLNILEG